MTNLKCNHWIGRKAFIVRYMVDVVLQAVLMHRRVERAKYDLPHSELVQFFHQIDKLLFTSAPSFWRCNVHDPHAER